MFFLTLDSCFGKDDLKKHGPFQAALPDRSDKQVQVPKELVRTIEKLYLESNRSLHPEGELSDVELLSQISRKFLGFEVFLYPHKSSVALENAWKLSFPRGGGIIDLKNLVVGSSGSFFLAIRFHNEDLKLEAGDLQSLRVYFLARAKRRQIGQESFGSGCGKYMDVTNFFRNVILKKGLKLNATEARYFNVVAGTFYFVLLKGGVLNLGTVSFEDSRYTDQLCPV